MHGVMAGILQFEYFRNDGPNVRHRHSHNNVSLCIYNAECLSCLYIHLEYNYFIDIHIILCIIQSCILL